MLLQFDGVGKSIGVLEILKSVTFIVEQGQKVALVGVNGAGKTSVFRLITGQWRPDSGAISAKNGMRLGYLPQLGEQDGGDEPDAGRTLYETLGSVFAPLKKTEARLRELEAEMAGLGGERLEAAMRQYDRLMAAFEEEDGYSAESRVKGVLRGLGFAESQWGQAFGTLSGGQKTRALLGKLLLGKADLLLLDEPTNHLDIASVEWLEDYLRGFAGAAMLISHDRYFLDRVATRTVEIENKKAVAYNGNYTHFVEKKARDLALAKKHFAENQKTIKHHEEVIKTLRSYKTEAKIILAKSREKLLAKIERVEKPAEPPEKMRLKLAPKIKSGNDVLSVKGLSMSFGPLELYSGISFEVRRGDRTALIGPNGVGKTTLFKNIAGIIPPTGGRIDEGVNVRMGYYDQSHTFSAESEAKPVFGELADTYPRLGQTEIRNVLAAFMFKGDDVFKPIAALSGGERGRVQLAKIMLAGANFLVLDEPTNHLDIYSKEILEDALRGFDGALLYISHDRYFINNTATKIMELSAGGIAAFFGNYDSYLEKKAPAAQEPRAEEKPGQKDEWRQKKESEAAARKKAAKIKRLEDAIAGLEADVKRIDAEMEKEENARDAEKARALYEERERAAGRLAGLVDEWGLEN